jgi:tRNA 2-thiocytidine biosynthesis protein TtcA
MSVEGHFYFTTKKVGKAIWEHGLIRDGDRVVVAVSGGKDSLCLLRILKERLKFVPIHYDILAVHVDMGFPWVDVDGLRRHFESESVPFAIVQPPEVWGGDGAPLHCFWCSWNRRKALFRIAREEKCNRIALAHHMDDIIETILLNLFFQGEIGTMTPFQEMFKGELALIRPLAYVEEKELLRLAGGLGLPVTTSACPRSDVSKRRLVKGMITELKKHNPHVKKNIYRSLTRVREEYLLQSKKQDKP